MKPAVGGATIANVSVPYSENEATVSLRYTWK